MKPTGYDKNGDIVTAFVEMVWIVMIVQGVQFAQTVWIVRAVESGMMIGSVPVDWLIR